MANFEVNAFDLSAGEIGYYLTVLTAKQIFEMSKVSRVDEDPAKGYQRHLNIKRAESISDYLNAGNVIPGAIILSAQKNAKVTYSNGKLNIEAPQCSFFVIDGQHRLYGSALVANDILLPVCILVGLDHTTEVKYFIDINSTQKGVPRTLRIELMKFLSEPDSIDELRGKLFEDLNNSVESPLFERMSATHSASGKISHVPFKSSIDPILKGDVLSAFPYEDKKKLIINFLSATSEILTRIEGNDDRLTSSAFFQAIFRVFDKACHLSMVFKKNYSLESLIEILEGISTIDFTKHSSSNNQGISELSNELQNLLDLHSIKLGTPSDLF